jgi:hypothetical protein
MKTMNEEKFWKLIEKLDWNKTGDDDAVINPVCNALSDMSVEEIFGFEELLSEKLYALDTKAHAREIGKGAYVGEGTYFSVDWFLYCRCAAVANGKIFYESVINNPKKFPKDIEFEALLSIAREAYDSKELGEWVYVTTKCYETYSNLDNWKNDEVEKPKPKPKLGKTIQGKVWKTDRTESGLIIKDSAYKWHDSYFHYDAILEDMSQVQRGDKVQVKTIGIDEENMMLICDLVKRTPKE